MIVFLLSIFDVQLTIFQILSMEKMIVNVIIEQAPRKNGLNS